MGIAIRDAGPADVGQVVELVKELAASMGENSPITEDYAAAYLGFPGSAVLLAEDVEAGGAEGRRPVGLLSYSVRPGLFHAANSALIEELVVAEGHRGKGAGKALLEALLERLEKQGCAEVSVTTMPDNDGALRFYRSHGLIDEAVYLEKHFDKPTS